MTNVTERRSETAVIVGGGLAGLAACEALSQRGIRVKLFEAQPRLGGRAGSHFDRSTGMWVDHCQHVTLGCCTNFEQFCRSLALWDFFELSPAVHFIPPGEVRADRTGEPCTCPLRASWLPAPLHLGPSMHRWRFLSRPDRRAIRQALKALALADPAQYEETSMAEWLRMQQQSPTAVARFWNLVLVSALSDSLDRIGFVYGRKVFVDAFLANRHGWTVCVPVVPLGRLYGQTLAEALRARGVQIELGSAVRRIRLANERAVGVELRDGREVPADWVIVAVPHHRVKSLVPESLASHPHLAYLDQLTTAPITSVHLWFDRPITRRRHVVLVDRLGQWVFNRAVTETPMGNRFGSNGATDSTQDCQQEASLFHYQVVISASHDLADGTFGSQEEIVARIRQELSEVFPRACSAVLQRARVITDRRAVFSPAPGVDRWRPPQQSPVANLQWAGDWTATGWPATMEGAVRSGLLAAENVLRQLGRPERLIRADLPVARLSKLLLRL